MIWLVIVVVLVILLAARLGLHELPAEEISYRARVDLYAIRRRLEVAQFKSEVRRDGARLRREMRSAIDRQHAKDRGIGE
jgi:hypothetical protein